MRVRTCLSGELMSEAYVGHRRWRMSGSSWSPSPCTAESSSSASASTVRGRGERVGGGSGYEDKWRRELTDTGRRGAYAIATRGEASALPLPERIIPPHLPSAQPACPPGCASCLRRGGVEDGELVTPSLPHTPTKLPSSRPAPSRPTHQPNHHPPDSNSFPPLSPAPSSSGLHVTTLSSLMLAMSQISLPTS